MARLGRQRSDTNTWPGFVDALATLLMVIIFLLMIFVLAQFFLGQAIVGRDDALQRLQSQIGELAELLSLERRANTDLRRDIGQIFGELQASVDQRENFAIRIESLLLRAEGAENEAGRLNRSLEEAFRTILTDKSTLDEQNRRMVSLANDITALQALRDELRRDVAAMTARLTEAEGDREQLRVARRDLTQEKEISEAARAQLALLNRQTAALREQLNTLNAALAAAEATAANQKVEISNLGSRLNAALASRVQELSRYRSEFFGRLRDVLGDQPGVRIVGDRFVFQSEVLFDTGSADIGEAGHRQLSRLAETLIDIGLRIPVEIDWVLRIDGHTDRVPIATARFPSNWELSSARAISVVRLLMERGIPANRLAATGFSEFQPLDPGTSPAALSRNRRIELKLTER